MQKKLKLQRAPEAIKATNIAYFFMIGLFVLVIGTELILSEFSLELESILFIIIFSILLFQTHYFLKQIRKESLVLDHEGIHYQSGLPLWMTWMQPTLRDWKASWPSIQVINIIPSEAYGAIQITFKVRDQDKPYKTLLFQWVDSETLDESHIKSSSYSKLRFRKVSQVEFEDYLNCSPLYQYLIHNKISVTPSNTKFFNSISQSIISYALLAVISVAAIVLLAPFAYKFYASGEVYSHLETKQFSISYDTSKSYTVPQYYKNQWFGHDGNVLAVATSPDGRYVASSGTDQTVRLWDLQTGKNIKTFTGHTDRIHALMFHPDGQSVVSGSEDDTIRIWSLNDEQAPITLIGDDIGMTWYSGIYDIAFSPDGRYLASGNWDGSTRVWDLQTKTQLWIDAGNQIENWFGLQQSIDAVAFSPDGKTIATGGFDNMVRLWDAQTGKQLRVFEGHKDWLKTVTFSPDGKMLASSGCDHSIFIWDINTAEALQIIHGHKGDISDLAFTKNSEVLISASDDFMIRYWEVSTGANIAELKGHTDYVNSIALTPDEKILVSGSGDDSIKIWTLQDD